MADGRTIGQPELVAVQGADHRSRAGEAVSQWPFPVGAFRLRRKDASVAATEDRDLSALYHEGAAFPGRNAFYSTEVVGIGHDSL